VRFAAAHLGERAGKTSNGLPARADVGRRRRPTPVEEHVMERKELVFFIAMGGFVLAVVVAVLSRFV
jgi:hypothetical protein